MTTLTDNFYFQDMRLTFYNSILYNPLSHPIHIAAVEFLKMLTSLLSDFVSTKLGPNLTPAPEAVTGGLDIWLKKFQLFAGANSIQLSFTAANTATEVTPSNNIALHFDGANDVNVVAIVSEGSTTLDNPCEEKRNMDVSSDCGEHCVASVSKDAEDSNGEVFVDADDDQCDDNHNLMDEDYRHSENYYNDDTEGAGVDQSFRTTHTANTYPAPIGFCRQDSTLNLSHFSTGDGHVNMSPTCEEFGRSSASLLEGSRMSSAVAGIRTSISQQHLPPSVGSVVPEVKFKVAALGLKGVCSLMNDLSKAALRFKDDLFVIRLLNSPLECFSSVKLEHASSPCKNTVNAENNAELIDVWKNWLNSSNLNSEVFLEYFHGVILNGNTTDPDPIMPSPFVDSRHTFLEMCQYRHYQFDSFRRAKHSSMMLLYHLHHPQMSSLRPVCVSCKSAIKEIRWHCELCSHYDLCARCVSGKVGSSHQHPLIPFRVTYM